MDKETSANLLGRTLSGRYRIESELGEGGMGAVYLARDVELNGRSVVLKFPHAEQLHSPNFLLRFEDEIRSLARLDHPHIIKIHDSGQDEGVPFAVVQYVGGGDLRERLDHASQTPGEIVGWLRPVSEALDYVHRNGFCHRDVKPANIFFDEDGHAFLSDFGIATGLDSVNAQDTQVHSQRTQIGTFVGSPMYCPPEALGRDISPAYDQYSLAVTVYQALCGDLPFKADIPMDYLIAKNNEAPREIRQLVPQLPERSAAAIMRALSKSRSERFPSCLDFYLEFAAGVEGTHGATAAAGGARALLPAIAVIVTGALLAAGLWLFAGDAGQRRLPGELHRTPGPAVIDALHRVEIGSTEQEFRDAIGLCRLSEPACDGGWFASEAIHKTVLAPYAIDLQELTAGEFATFVERTGYVTGAEQRGHSFHNLVQVNGLSWRHPEPDVSEGGVDPNLPVVHVSFFDAEAFCKEAGMRLPTQDEWEHAARGDDRRLFPWGNEWDPERAAGGRPGLQRVEPASSRPEGASRLGHVQMAGNAAEWTATVASGDRVIRGGSWQDENPAHLRSAARSSESPDYSSSDLGFRCAADPQPR